MPQPTAREVWDQLVAETRATRLFKDVKALPVNVVNDVRFLDNFPGLKLPACIIVLLDRDRTVQGSGDERNLQWNAILVARDPQGEAYGENIDRLEKLEAAICDRYILDNQVIVHGTTSARPASTNPRFSVYQLALSTRQADERAPE